MKQGIVASCAAAISLTLFACSTADRPLETPRGPRPAESTGPLIILGLVSKATSTLKRNDAHQPFDETVTIGVPVGTVAIVPTVRGFTFGYGTTTPEDLAQSDPAKPLTWHTEDHNFGVQSLNIFVEDIDAPDPNTNTQTAKIHISALLSDDNSDDTWFGYVNYTLLCLGNHP